MNCYVCDIEINNENETNEHIIPNAIGGRLKSKELICKECNSKFGNEIDAALASQLKVLSNIFMIKRHRGTPLPIILKDSNEKEYVLQPNGQMEFPKPNVEKTSQGDKVIFSITARDEKELKNILKGIAAKYPHFDTDEANRLAERSEHHFDDFFSVGFKVGGDEVFRAVCKCAVNFYLYKNGDSSQIKHLLPFIKGTNNKRIVWLHYKDNLYELSDNECFHVIHLVGNMEDRVLYCYIDFFNTCKYLILLNDNYQGENIKESYCFDLINVKEIQRKILIDYDRATLLDFFNNLDDNPFKKMKMALKRSLSFGMKRQNSSHIMNDIKSEINSFLEEYSGESPVELANKMTEITLKHIKPYISKRMDN